MDGLGLFGHECWLMEHPTPFGLWQGTELDRYFMNPRIIDIVRDANPDILWTNDPCRVGNYRLFFDGKIVAYNHWIDNFLDPKMPLKKTYFFRQLEALYKADLLLFNSNFGLDFFLDGISGINGSILKDEAEIGYMNPPLRTALLREALNRGYKTPKPSLAFNHRLSSAPQYKDNVDKLLQLMSYLDLTYGQNNYEVYVSNPSQKTHPLLGRPNVFNMYNPSYSEYIRVLASCWTHVSFFNYPGQWSMSIAEALCLGLNIYAPRHSGYCEVTQGFAHDIDQRSIPEIAGSIIRTWKPSIQTAQSKFFLERYSPEYIVKSQLLPKLGL
jgi:hypothetical protein